MKALILTKNGEEYQTQEICQIIPTIYVFQDNPNVLVRWGDDVKEYPATVKECELLGNKLSAQYSGRKLFDMPIYILDKEI